MLYHTWKLRQCSIIITVTEAKRIWAWYGQNLVALWGTIQTSCLHFTFLHPIFHGHATVFSDVGSITTYKCASSDSGMLSYFKLFFILQTIPLPQRSWLRHCATSRKVAGSIPDGVIGIFHWHNPSGRTMALGVDSASNRNEYQEYFLGVKAAVA